MTPYNASAVEWRVKSSTGRTTVDPSTGRVVVAQDETAPYTMLEAEIDHQTAEAVVSNPAVTLAIVTPTITGERGDAITIETNKPIRAWKCASDQTTVEYQSADPLHPIVKIGANEGLSEIAIIGALDNEIVKRVVTCANPVFAVLPRALDAVDGDTHHFAPNRPGLTDVVWSLTGASSTATTLIDGTVTIGRDEVDGSAAGEPKTLVVSASSASIGATASAEVHVSWSPHLMPAAATIGKGGSVRFLANWDVDWEIFPYDETVTRFDRTQRRLDVAFSDTPHDWYQVRVSGAGHDATANIVIAEDPPLPVISVEPSTANVLNGADQAYIARGTGLYAVTWAISGNQSDDTTIDPDTGILHMGWNEPGNSKIIITATVEDGSTGTASAIAEHTFLASVSDIDAEIGKSYEIRANEPADGITWGLIGSAAYGDGIHASEWVGDAIDDPLGCTRAIFISPGEYSAVLAAYIHATDGSLANIHIAVSDHLTPRILDPPEELDQGARHHFSADVPADQWEIMSREPITSPDTTIDAATGELVIGWDETASNIGISMHSAYGQASARVTVHHVPLLRPETIDLNQQFIPLTIETNEPAAGITWVFPAEVQHSGTWVDPATGLTYDQMLMDDLKFGWRAISPASSFPFNTAEIVLIDTRNAHAMTIHFADDHGTVSSQCTITVPARLTIPYPFDPIPPYVGLPYHLHAMAGDSETEVSGVTWAVSGVTDEETEINDSGVIYIGACQSTTTPLTVRVSKSGYFDGTLEFTPKFTYRYFPRDIPKLPMLGMITLHINADLADLSYEYDSSPNGLSARVASEAYPAEIEIANLQIMLPKQVTYTTTLTRKSDGEVVSTWDTTIDVVSR